MKVYKLEILVLDFDGIGAKEIKNVIENTHYPNHCISPTVMDIKEEDIGEWNDDHPLNNLNRREQAYKELFPK